MQMERSENRPENAAIGYNLIDNIFLPFKITKAGPVNLYDNGNTISMSYTLIDPIITAWTKRHGLVLFTRYQDSDVRSVDVVGINGHRFQIWIERPTEKLVSVHAWDYKQRRQDWKIEIEKLNTSLEEAIQIVKSWETRE
jgi:hypothetical protein